MPQVKRAPAVRKTASLKSTVSAKTKYVYFFGSGKAEGKAEMKYLLGGKGANLAEMVNLGVPVPPGFTITTQACIRYSAQGKQWPAGLEEQVATHLAHLEQVTGKGFGDPKNPLLVSVRSGAAFSMPGMMDTILNLGLNDATVQGMIQKTENPRFAYDAYRRFMQMFSNVVLGIKHELFEHALEARKRALKVILDPDVSAEGWKALIGDYHKIVKEQTGRAFPTDPKEQLRMAINAVFSSWNNDRATTYRNLNKIPHDLGTGVNVQSMVFGNMGGRSMTGVCFTRNPSTGEAVFYGEYLVNAQGEDVVAGIRTPQPIAKMAKEFPALYKQLHQICQRLETHYRDLQDLEFTVEEGTLFLLQTRNGKRTAQAAVRVAVELVKEKLIDKHTALLRVNPEQLDQLLHPTVDPKAKVKIIAKGLPASPGAAVGQIVFHAQRAMELAEGGVQVILVRQETSPEDIGGMAAAQGILTARGGMTSHAAVVGRGMGKCCVVGCNELIVREDEHRMSIGQLTLKEGDVISLNGSTGEVMLGEVSLVTPTLTDSFRQLLVWADQTRKLQVRANADTPGDAKVARNFGAEGIGLCRTEHMFFGEERLPIVREMILAKDTAARKASLAKLLPFQKADFLGLFKEMAGLPVTIRLLDPPLHEFVPQTPEDIEKVATQMGVSVQQVTDTVKYLHEVNPMLGHRGCRLGVTFPEIIEMQARAIFEAACELNKQGQRVIPEVMVPLVGHVNEFTFTKRLIVNVANETMQRYGVQFKYLIGTMIEVPRAAVVADEIAKEAEFFSFGTNDLTQMTFGFSRDDIGKFLPHYLKEGILKQDPFIAIDQAGVGALMRMGIDKGRGVRKDLKVGICGEHGGESSSVEFCHRIGLNYVSCSPFRVPIARLAAAQAVVRKPSK